VGDLADYVLHPMRKMELEAAGEMIGLAAQAVSAILTEGPARAMERFNRRASPPEETEG